MFCAWGLLQATCGLGMGGGRRKLPPHARPVRTKPAPTPAGPVKKPPVSLARSRPTPNAMNCAAALGDWRALERVGRLPQHVRVAAKTGTQLACAR